MVAAFHRRFGSPPPERRTSSTSPAPCGCSLIRRRRTSSPQAVAAGDLVEMVDALCDLLYVTYGAAVDLGVDLQPFFAEVHRCNMAKVGGRRREDGKWLKPAGWTPPDIAGLLRPPTTGCAGST